MGKKFSKCLTALMVLAVTLSTGSFTAFATETDTDTTPTPAVTATEAATTPAPYGVEVALYLMESNEEWSYGDQAAKDWSEPKSESVFITEDGTYTLSLTDLEIPTANFMLCYIKDVAAYPKDTKVTHSNVPDDLMVITDVFKVNGSVKTVSENVRTGLKKGIFDVAYHNEWDKNDNNVEFNKDVTSVELTFTVTGITGEPGAIKYAPPTEVPATPTVAAVTTTTDTSATDATATDTAAASNTSDDDKSGSTLPIVIGIAAVLVLAIVLIIIFRKKK
jgi:hypothetical protein